MSLPIRKRRKILLTPLSGQQSRAAYPTRKKLDVLRGTPPLSKKNVILDEPAGSQLTQPLSSSSRWTSRRSKQWESLGLPPALAIAQKKKEQELQELREQQRLREASLQRINPSEEKDRKPVPNLKADPFLARERQKLRIPDAGKSLYRVSRWRDSAYEYSYTKKGKNRNRTNYSYSHWNIAFVDKGRNRLFNREGLQLADGWYMYVITTDNEFRYLPTANKPFDNLSYTQYRCHSQMAEGQNVYSAGAFQVKDGAIVRVNVTSGHYRPGKKYLEYTKAVLGSMGLDINRIDFRSEFKKSVADFGVFSYYARVAKRSLHATAICAFYKASESKKADALAKAEGRPEVPRHMHMPY